MRRIKKFIACLLVVITISNLGLSPFSSTAFAAPIIEIHTAQELHDIRNNLSGHFRLMNSIDLSGWDWMPIGTAFAPFSGTLDGNGFAIINLEVVTAPTRDLVGLFGRNDGVITNIGLISAYIRGGISVGSIAGSNTGQIHNSFVAGDSSVFGEGMIGGLVGVNSGAITRSYSTAFVSGGGFVGGFAGSNSGEISQSFSMGDVRTNTSYIGGFVGGMLGETSRIQNSFTISNITTNNYLMSSGFIGHLIAGTITNSFAVSNSPNGFHHSGGAGALAFAAHNLIDIPGAQYIQNIETLVRMRGFMPFGSSDYIEPLAALSSNVVNSFFDSDRADGGFLQAEGRTTQQMMSRSTFTGWDFNTIWNIEEGQNYPFLRGMPRPDLTPPVVLDVLPRNGETLGLNPFIRILVEDETDLLSVHAQYERGGIWHDIDNHMIFAGERQPIQSFGHLFVWNNEAFPYDEVTIRYFATDVFGNASEPTYITYDVRNRIASRPVVNAVPGGMRMNLNITPIPGGVTYNLYRIEGIQIRQLAEFDANDALIFTDHHLNPALEYSYFVTAIDANGNVINSDITTATPLNYDSYAPIAVAGYDFYAVAGIPTRFDGLASFDNVGIVAFEWDFGDYGIGTGGAPMNTFEEPGEYDVVLTVRDAAGNEDTDTIRVTVFDAAYASSLRLSVIDDETGARIPGANVFVDFSASGAGSTLIRTDASGISQITAPVSGVHSVAVFAHGFLPEERHFDFAQGAFIDAEIRLTRGEVGIGSVETRALTLDEIIEMGIDITDPANRHVFEVEVVMVFAGRTLPPMNLTVSGGGGFWGGGGWGSGWGSGGWGSFGGFRWQSGGSGGTIFPGAIPSPRPDEPPTLVFLNLQGTGYFLRSFFEVSKIMYNQASARFPLQFNSADIILPYGLSLAPIFGGQTFTNEMPDIPGGESAQTSWIVRADAAGTLNIGTTFNGSLMPFGEPLTISFETSITVNDSYGLTLYITPDEIAYRGEPFQTQFSLVNNSPHPINNLSFQFGDELLEAATLMPGDGLHGTLSIIFPGGTGRDVVYYALIDMVIRVRGINVVLNWNPPSFGQQGFGRDYWVNIFNNSLGIETHVGDPICLVNGNLIWYHTDFELHGAQNLTFTRFYNSQNDVTTAVGRGWRHSFDYRLVLGAGGARVTVPSGREYIFTQTGDVFTLAGTSAPDVTLEQTPDGYLFALHNGTRINFDDNGQAITIADVRGNTTSLSYEYGRLISAQNRSGIMHFEYEDELITGIRDNFGRLVRYVYDNLGRPIQFTNADGNTLDFVYDREGNLIEMTDFNGDIFMRNRFVGGQVFEQYLADQGTSRFSYNPASRTTTFTNALGEVFVYHYNESYQITAVTERNGARRQTFADGHLTSFTNQLGYTTYLYYDANGNIIRITHPDGTTEHFTYNAMRLRTNITHRDGTTESFEYDDRGNLVLWTDQRGNTRTFVYNMHNDLMSFADANGEQTAFTHDARGNITSITDPSGSITRFEHDNFGRITTITAPNGDITRNAYSLAGKLLSRTDPAGNVHNFGVNGNGFIVSMEDPMGNRSVITYDRMNQPVSITNLEGNRQMHRYDAAGNLVQITDPEGNVTRFEYDGLGLLTRRIDALGNVWQYSHDAAGRLTQITDPYGNATSFVYDAMGRVVSATNARGAVTSFTYDRMGRITSVVDAMGGTQRTAYDANGNVASLTDANGNTWTFEYDNENRLIRDVCPLGIETIYTYDTRGNLIRTYRDSLTYEFG
ncbi:MAG: DUF6531 domain-containing protein, partial [Defluviitaleaceae bacterium]|nr:DUF6531 domain-containing protein [Defluviitaleaceae bacterium]